MAIADHKLPTPNPQSPTGGCSTIKRLVLHYPFMKQYVHARLSAEERAMLEELKTATGYSESELLRRGLRSIFKEYPRRQSALQLAGRSAGKFKGGPTDLSTNKKYFAGFGE